VHRLRPGLEDTAKGRRDEVRPRPGRVLQVIEAD
jgi:hypothetical protein